MKLFLKREGKRNKRISGYYLGEDILYAEDIFNVFLEVAESFTKTAEMINNINMGGVVDSLNNTTTSVGFLATDMNSLIKELKEVSKQTKKVLYRVENKLIDNTLFKLF